MRIWHGCALLCAAALLPGLAFAQKREYVELQREIVNLQDQVQKLQTSMSENTGLLNGLVRQALDGIGRLSKDVAVLDAAMRDQNKNIAAPVAGVNTRMDSMAGELQALKVSVDDLSARMAKLQQTMVDLSNTIKVIQAPAAQPPGPTGSTAPGGGGPGPGVSAESLYSNAMRDKDAGSYDIALQEFTDYLRYFATTDLAPNAQYYIGEIYYNQKNYPEALKAFDTVLERYSENNKSLDARYMKGRALFLMGEKTKAAQEFRQVYSLAPRSELGAKAKAQLSAMGLSTGAPAPKKAAARRKK